MAADLSAPAGHVLAAALVTPPPAQGWAAVRRFAGALVKVAADAANPEDAAARRDVLVTRRDTGAEVLRVDRDNGDPDGTVTLNHVQSQLDELTLGEFLDKWGLDPGTLD